jgi:hypothetical protein
MLQASRSQFVNREVIIMRSISLPLFLLLVFCTTAFAASEKISVRGALFYSPEVILVRDAPSPYATPYQNNQVREQYDYYICAGLELKNTTQGELKKSILCNFVDKWEKSMAMQRISVTLQPGGKDYRIVNSGLKVENLSSSPTEIGFKTTLSDPMLTKGEQSTFIASGEGLTMGDDLKIQAQINRSLTEVRCVITQD